MLRLSQKKCWNYFIENKKTGDPTLGEIILDLDRQL